MIKLENLSVEVGQKIFKSEQQKYLRISICISSSLTQPTYSKLLANLPNSLMSHQSNGSSLSYCLPSIIDNLPLKYSTSTILATILKNLLSCRVHSQLVLHNKSIICGRCSQVRVRSQGFCRVILCTKIHHHQCRKKRKLVQKKQRY